MSPDFQSIPSDPNAVITLMSQTLNTITMPYVNTLLFKNSFIRLSLGLESRHLRKKKDAADGKAALINAVENLQKMGYLCTNLGDGTYTVIHLGEDARFLKCIGHIQAFSFVINFEFTGDENEIKKIEDYIENVF